MSAPGLDTHDRLGAELLRLLFPACATIESSREKGWASATFTGARHWFCLIVPGATRELMEGVRLRLKDHEFRLPHDLVADVSIAEWARDAAGQGRLTVEALTVEEG